MIPSRTHTIARIVLVAALAVVSPGTSTACVGSECLQIWSTAAGDGNLAVEFDFDSRVQTYETFCTPDRGLCLFTAIDPGFIAGGESASAEEFHPLIDGTAVTLEVIATDPGFAWRVNGRTLAAGESAALGMMPDIHVHPTWQIEARDDARGEYVVRFRLRSLSPRYGDSPEYAVVVTNAEPSATPTPLPTATATPGVPACTGDCSADGAVTVDEIVRGVAIALGTDSIESCPRFDANDDAAVRVDEIVGAIRAALEGCEALAAVDFEMLQAEIFTPRCATALCHDDSSEVGDLNLSEGTAYEQLVGVPPEIESARAAGLLRVTPGDPAASFLWLKLIGPPPIYGSRMPLTGEPLSPADLERVRRWIVDGASR